MVLPHVKSDSHWDTNTMIRWITHTLHACIKYYHYTSFITDSMFLFRVGMWQSSLVRSILNVPPQNLGSRFKWKMDWLWDCMLLIIHDGCHCHHNHKGSKGECCVSSSYFGVVARCYAYGRQVEEDLWQFGLLDSEQKSNETKPTSRDGELNYIRMCYYWLLLQSLKIK